MKAAGMHTPAMKSAIGTANPTPPIVM
jgi:hypothetical protein